MSVDVSRASLAMGSKLPTFQTPAQIKRQRNRILLAIKQKNSLAQSAGETITNSYLALRLALTLVTPVMCFIADFAWRKIRGFVQ